MAQPATNPKIEELRFRLKSDPKNRIFYPLAEELRKVGQYAEAEQVLRAGLANHPTYLSAWVSLGRVLRELKNDAGALEALNRALQLDPGNVVAARLLADTYLGMGEKVEAIKKYKLVYALYPADEELEAMIAKLEGEINAPGAIPEAPAPAAAPPSVAAAPAPAPAPSAPAAVEPPPFSPPESDRVFDETASSILKRQRFELETGDAEPMSAAHAESPFEEPAAPEAYGKDAFSIEQPGGMHVARAPLTAELPVPTPPEPSVPADEADVFEPAPGAVAPGFVTPEFAVTSALPPLDEADFAKTIRMADLYASEGSIDEARDIYEDLLARDPNNASIRAKLEALAPVQPATAAPAAEQAAAPEPAPAAAESEESKAKVAKLENWLARVKRGEVGRV